MKLLLCTPIVLALMNYVSIPGSAQVRKLPNNSATPRLQAFLQAYAKTAGQDTDRTTRFAAAQVSLHDPRSKQVIVYLSGQSWCGSGGCTTIVLDPTGASFTLLSEIGVTHLPITLLQTRTNGWHDLGVMVAGGGIANGYMAALPFNHRKYAENPTTAPAHRASKKLVARVLISDQTQAIPLFP